MLFGLWRIGGEDEQLRELVIVRKKEGGDDVDLTVDLLNAVYNGTKTEMKAYACQQLKNKLLHELMWFREKTLAYKQTSNNENRLLIERMLSDCSLFAAFKREIVRNDPVLSKDFRKCQENRPRPLKKSLNARKSSDRL